MSTKNFLHIALVPARSGSIGIRNKNLRKLGGKSLVKRAWDSCVNADFFDVIMLSTDSARIMKEIDTGIAFPSLSTDTVTFFKQNRVVHKRNKLDAQKYSSISDVLRKISHINELQFDFLWLIQPTTPFRFKKEFLDLKKISESSIEYTSIVSVKDVTQSHPNRMFELPGVYLEPIINNSQDVSVPRQMLSKVYIKDGGYYIFKKEQLQSGNFLGRKILPFERPSDLNVNIDTHSDLAYAKFISRKYNL